MKSGVIGVVEGEFDTLESATYSFTKDGWELEEAIDIRQPITLSDGKTAIYGRAAQQDTNEVETVQIQEEGIGTYPEIEVETTYTEFLVIPGEFVIVGSGAGSFAFDIIGRQTDCLIERGKVNLDEYVRDLREKDRENEVWQAGFYGNDGHAEKGIVYGQNVLDDTNVGGVLDLSTLNQLGLIFSTDEDKIKMTLTESGYLNVYQPSNYESDEFLEFFRNEIAHHVEKAR